jgi:acyl-CoA thioester hydrolase
MMFSHEITIRVRYAETDQMRYVYYGNYATYYEVARVEAFRFLGVSYRELEEQGIGMPVLELWTKYIRPAKYDDLLTIKVMIKETPTLKITFEYEVYNEQNTLLNMAKTTLVFIDLQTAKPVRCPDILLNSLEKWMDEKKEG